MPGVDVTEDVTVEVRYGSFRRSFTLPAHVAADAISAGYDAGVLSVRVTGAYAGNAAHRIPVERPSPTRAAGDDGERPAA